MTPGLGNVPITAHAAVEGVIWSSASRVAQQILQFAVSVVLARLLTPSAFGLVAIILVFTLFLQIFVDSGLGAALVQRQELEERHLNSAFWLNMVAGVALTLALAGLSPLVAKFYDEPQLVGLTIALSINFLVSSVAIVQLAMLQRTMRFRRLAMVENTATLSGGTLGIAAAIAGLGVWSLVVQLLATTTIRTTMAWATSSWRPRLLVDRAAIRDLWGFSAHLLGFNALNYWARNADNFLIGKFVGTSALGIYARAYSTMLLPSNQVTNVISKVMFPAMSRMQDDQVRLKRAYLRTIAILALVSFPLAAGLLTMAEPFVLTVYGEKWRGVVRILEILSFPALTQSIASTNGLVFQARGRTDWLWRWGVFASLVTLASFAIGIHWGATGVASAYSIRTALLLYPSFSIPGRLIDMRVREVGSVVKEALVASAVMAATVWTVSLGLSGVPVQVRLAVDIVVAASVYAGVIAVLKPAAASDLRLILRQRIGGRRRAGAEPAAPADQTAV